MPIPIIIAAGIFAGVVGAGGHMCANDTNEEAQDTVEKAKKIYADEKNILEKKKAEAEQALINLGYEKKYVLYSSMNQFISLYEKIKTVQRKESGKTDELSKLNIDPQGVLEIKNMSDIYSSSIQSGVTGAATGAIIALAASGSLSLVTSGLTTAGSILMLGGVETAASVAGSVLSFGASMTPLSAVVAPVVLFTGISASIKADENLEKAKVMYAEAKEAVEKMKVSEILCNGIVSKSDMYKKLLIDLNKMFAECANELESVIMRKEYETGKKRFGVNDFTDAELDLISVTRSLAGAVKAVLDTPILNKNGNISYEAEKTSSEIKKSIPQFEKKIKNIGQKG